MLPYYHEQPGSAEYRREQLYMARPQGYPSMAWLLELQLRGTDRSRFPDTANLWGEYKGYTTSWTQSGVPPRQAISYGTPFTLPYRGEKSITTWGAPPERVGIDEERVSAVDHPEMFPRSQHSAESFLRPKFKK